MNITLVPSLKGRLRGKFFFSRKQFSWLRKDRPYLSKRESVHPRMFCQLDSGEIREYTEMISEDVFASDLKARALCEEMFDDVVVLGYGAFHHHGEDVC
jgi:murein endopeptidase